MEMTSILSEFESESLESAKASPIPKGNTQTQVGHVMVVDDEESHTSQARKELEKAGYRHITEINDATEALSRFYSDTPDVLLLDESMPRVSGLEIVQTIRADELFASIPILILTEGSDRELKAKALQYGASDFIAKPIDSIELIPRVRNALIAMDRQNSLERLVRQRTAELERSRREVIHCLARAAEFRDNETGYHVLRVGKYAGLLALELGFGSNEASVIEQAATLHDVGKIGIPDSILLKPGKLEPEEYEFIQKHSSFGKKIVGRMDATEFAAFSDHTDLGSTIIGDCSSPILQLASRIALTHHEKWDGSGYPLGLAGEDIPIEGRITAVADVFDALSSRRPYKPAYSLAKCIEILEDGREQHFDPRVLDAFTRCKDELVKVQIDFADNE